MAEKKKKKAAEIEEDVNVLAKSIMEQATGQPTKEPFDPEIIQKAIAEGKDPLAVLLGQRGGLKGGKARAARLTKEQRSEIARGAAKARWGKLKK